MANMPVRAMSFATLPLQDTDLFYVVQGTSSGSNDRKLEYKDLTNDSGVTAGSYGDSTHVGQFTVNAKGRITGASNVAISGGGGGSSGEFTFAQNVASYNTGITTPAGNFTVGIKIYPQETLTLTAVKFVWTSAAGTHNVKVTVWDRSTNDAAGVNIGSVTVSASSGGTSVITATFGSPITLTARHFITIAIYDTSAGHYVTAVSSILAPSVPFVAGNTIYLSLVKFIAGDGEPTSTGTTERYPIEIVAS